VNSESQMERERGICKRRDSNGERQAVGSVQRYQVKYMGEQRQLLQNKRGKFGIRVQVLTLLQTSLNGSPTCLVVKTLSSTAKLEAPSSRALKRLICHGHDPVQAASSSQVTGCIICPTSGANRIGVTGGQVHREQLLASVNVRTVMT